MSSNKRPIDWLSLPDLRNANKRPKSPAPQAGSSAPNAGQPQTTQTDTSRATSNYSNPNHPLQTTPLSTPAAQLGAPISGKGNKTAHGMLSTLKISMKVLQRTGQIFKPLQSAADTLLEVLESIEVSKQGSEGLCVATADLHEWVVALSGYLDSSQPQQMSESVQQLIRQESRLEGLKPAHDARYDSTFSTEVERGECLANTRVSVLDGIYTWIRDGNNTKIHWTNGMAGTGKTTIAYTICAGLERDGRLGASFFCSRASPDCRDVNRVLPTIAYQLAQQFYPFRSSLCRILGEQPSIGRRNIAVQFDYLINTPMLEVKDLLPGGLVIVIDALDECSNPKAMDMMLSAVFRHAASLPVRFFLTSRPEPSITTTMLSPENQSRSILHLHNVEQQFVEADIETYLTTKLARLSLKHDQIKRLAERAGILFIYAATVSRYLLETGSNVYASTRLQYILAQTSEITTNVTRDIDMLYKTILDGVFSGRLEKDEMELIRRVMWTVVCAREPLTKGTLAIFLDTECDLVTAALQPLQSVLHVSESSEVVSTLHASFPEFLLGSERCGMALWCNQKLQNEHMAKRCFEVMAEQLRFNICRLDTSSRYDKDVTDLDDRVKAFVSAELAYACRCWSSHLYRSPVCDDLLVLLTELLEVRLLFWMEVLNLTGWISNARDLLSETDKWVSGATFSDVRDLIKDAYSFVTAFAANPIRQSTPHIYISALALYPKESRVWKIYSKRMHGLTAVDGTLAGQRASLATWAVDCTITSMSYSPDGRWIVFGADKGDIHIWDAYTGTPLGDSIRTHARRIYSVALSPDNTLVASGSDRGIVGIWNALNGTPFRSLFIGGISIRSLVFSPDGTQICCGSGDGAVRVWGVQSGILVCDPLDCGTGDVTCVAFSPDGTIVASACDDSKVRVWDIRSGMSSVPPLEGHTEGCCCVAFSPDGTRLASGSYDGAVILWDVRTGASGWVELKKEGFGPVSSLAFTTDGAYILSAQPLATVVAVWDAYRGTLVARFFLSDGADEDYNCVLSPNGTYAVAFGSIYACEVIAVWDVGSSTSVGAVFLPHDDAMVSSSANFTRTAVRMCNPCEFSVLNSRTGVPVCARFKGHGSVISLILSPDGSRIVSVSDDRTVQEWDVCSGALVSTPFAGIDTTHHHLTYSLDGIYLLACGADKMVRLWDMQQDRLVNSLFVDRYTTVIALSYNGSRIAYLSESGAATTVVVRDTHSGALVRNPFGRSSIFVWSIVFSSNAALIAVGYESGAAEVWEVQTGTLVSCTSKTMEEACVMFLPGNSRVATASATGVHVWDVGTGALLDTIMEGYFSVTGWIRNLADNSHLGLINHSLDPSVRVTVVWRFPLHPQPPSLLPPMLDIDKHGWVVDPVSNAPIFWLPAELRGDCEYIATSNTLLILPSGTFSLDFSNVLIGESWEQCYSPSNSV